MEDTSTGFPRPLPATTVLLQKRLFQYRKKKRDGQRRGEASPQDGQPEPVQSKETTTIAPAPKASTNPGGSVMPLRGGENTQKLAGLSALDNLPSTFAGTITNSVPREVTTQAVMYIGTLFIPGRVKGASLKCPINARCTHILLSRTAYDRLPTQQR